MFRVKSEISGQRTAQVSMDMSRLCWTSPRFQIISNQLVHIRRESPSKHFTCICKGAQWESTESLIRINPKSIWNHVLKGIWHPSKSSKLWTHETDPNRLQLLLDGSNLCLHPRGSHHTDARAVRNRRWRKEHVHLSVGQAMERVIGCYRCYGLPALHPLSNIRAPNKNNDKHAIHPKSIL